MRANTIRKGAVIMYNGAPHRVIDFHHHTPGNLRAMVQTKLRNILTGNQTETRFSATEDVPEADVHTSKATYLYSDNTGYHFMNSESYEEVTLNAEQLGDGIYYLQDQMLVDITTFEGNPVGINLPQTVVLTIVETEPELRGATASNSPKPAKTDTGLTLNVPPFLKQGEKIVVNTETGQYLSRAES
ncbi:MAG: elongation factor P [Proteobacteria bacterium]|nr:MAG: elongation factor P [Pseudomonadota bacterium]